MVVTVIFSGWYGTHFWFLQFLVVMVHVSGCRDTGFWYLWYLFLAFTVLVSGCYTILNLVVAVLVSGCSVCYSPRVLFCYAGTRS
jgi:hypothetical protein